MGSARQAARHRRSSFQLHSPLRHFGGEREPEIKRRMAITMNTVILRTPTGLLKILEIVRHISGNDVEV